MYIEQFKNVLGPNNLICRSDDQNISYDLDARFFATEAMCFYDKRHFFKLIEFSKEYLQFHPQHRAALVRFYDSLEQMLGYSHISETLAGIYAEVSDKLQTVGTTYYGLPPCFEEYPHLRKRIGELVDQTAYVHFMRKLNKQPQKPVIALTKDDSIANQAFLPYLEDNFEIISNHADAHYIKQHFRLAPYSTRFYKYSETQYGNVTDFYGSVYNELIEKKIDRSAFQLKDLTIEPAKNFLKSYGLKETDDFIVLHLRERGFVDQDFYKFRNVNPLDYMDAIDWLLSLGLKVVRIGHSKMTPLPERNGLIDLTCVDRPDEVDIYLCARAKFYYGSMSGPVALAIHFGSKILVTSTNVYGLNTPNALFQMLPFYVPQKQKPLTLDEIDALGLNMLNGISGQEIAVDNNLQPLFFKNADHLNSVKEMIEFLEDGKICKANDEMKVRTGREDLHSSFTSNSLRLITN